MYFPGDGRRFPWMTFYQSEASTAAMGPNYFEMNIDKVIGLAYWGAIDYLGESQGWPSKGWNQGVFDIDLNPKPKAWLMRSILKPEESVVHIGIVDKKGDLPWNGVQTGNDSMTDHWNRVPGTKFSLYTYTNAEEVELILNGKSLGTKQNVVKYPQYRNQIKWDNVEYQPGYLEAIARNGGNVVARHRIETTGDVSTLKATPDNASWQADGMDLQHVHIEALDKKGRLVQVAADEVTFSVEGDARIVGVINGCIYSNELTVGNTRKLFNGSCTVILRAGRKAGPVTLTASVPNLKPVKLKLRQL
jgi:beta-galactosidase